MAVTAALDRIDDDVNSFTQIALSGQHTFQKTAKIVMALEGFLAGAIELLQFGTRALYFN